MPIPTPPPDDIETLMTGYVLKTLSPEELVELESYLQANPDQVEVLRHYQEIS